MKTKEKVRKQFILDPAKIKMVKKITHASTETEAVNMALDMVIANTQIQKTLAAVKGKGKIEDAFGRVPV